MRTITLIPGDGIGPEVTEAAVRVVEASGVKINWERVGAGSMFFEKNNNPLPIETLDSIARNQVGLKGPLNTPIGEGYRSINVELRKAFNLFLNLRPIVSMPGVKSLQSNVNILLCRENTEELYTGEEKYIWDPETKEMIGAEAISRITIVGSERFFRSVFEYARKLNRKKVSVFHKANILKLTNSIFLNASKKIAVEFPDIEFENRIVDAGVMWAIMHPEQFDVIATTNMMGDIGSDALAGIVGGLGIAAGANIGKNYAIFEAVHGTWPAAAGKNIANPTAVILSAAMMLDHIGENKAANRVRIAVKSVIAEGKFVTRDLNPNGVGTTEMTDAIVDRLIDIHDIEAESCCD